MFSKAKANQLARTKELLDAETQRMNTAAGLLDQMAELNRATARRDALLRAQNKDSDDG